MKILTAAEMRECDRRTIEEHGVSSEQLMTRAGEAVARFLVQHFPEARAITVLCGKGNNGGDGLMAAAALANAGHSPRVLLLGRAGDLKGDPAEMLRRTQPHVPVVEIDSEADVQLPAVQQALLEAHLLVDAIVGTGFKPPLRPEAGLLRDQIARLRTPVVAVDLPSGWDADSLEYAQSEAVRADAVVTFTAPKLAHAFGNLTGSATKSVVIAAIGSPEEAIRSEGNLCWTGDAKRIAEAPREADDNKGKHGHVILFAGSHGKAGAPSMAAFAALRAGAGLVTAAVPASVLDTVALIAPELMTEPLPEMPSGALDPAFFGEGLDRLRAKKTVVAAGPGRGESEEAAALVHALLDRGEQPLVLDADALNIVSRDMDRLRNRTSSRPVVLTPHPGEMGRLAGISTAEVQQDRLGLARRFASEYRVTLVLKGWRTLVAHPSGVVAVNTTGNPGLAKGGSGDMLTGLVAALVAQYPRQPEQAVEAAVYLHGLAADFAVREQDEHTLLVTDVLAHLWQAFRYTSQTKDGYVWWEGLPR